MKEKTFLILLGFDNYFSCVGEGVDVLCFADLMHIPGA